MSGFEHYDRELRDLDKEIHRYAAICGVNLANRHEIEACLNQHHDTWAEDKARESLQGLLILRIKLEAEMVALGFTPPPLTSSTPLPEA
ncbi:hypothetical protein PTW32_17750 [Dechloromonas agitata]|uniref:hypothetical protein n=1 Tax=Dechloromonas agitata TaxID=73030 RepID=UPI00237DCB16|nr:hypothetical protein [Dechloromonas agitata]MDE1547262.1 hypothetical protein [Dechloromonas agitata]